MAREFTSEEIVPLSAGTDVWAKLAVMEKYALTKLGDDPYRSVEVRDVRGRDVVSSVEAAHNAWREHENPLVQIQFFYSHQSATFDVSLIAAHLDELDTQSRSLKPRIDVRVSSGDSGDARGTAAELADRGRSVGNPPLEETAEPSPLSSATTTSLAPRPGPLAALFAHPLVTTIVGGALATVVGTFLYSRFLG